MSTIKFDINSTLTDFISFYESSSDFVTFFQGIQHFYTNNQIEISEIGKLGIQEIHLITKSLHQYMNSNSNRKEEKNEGRFFTPKSVCRFINLRTLKSYGFLDKLTDTLPVILDPSSGLGFFLIDMFFLLLKIRVKRKNTDFKLKTLLTQIFGYEIDKETRNKSVYLLQSVLGVILSIHSFSDEFTEMKMIIANHLVQENFLHADIRFHPNIIVGNPPYVRVHKIDPKENLYLRENFYTARYDFDLYICFFEKCIRLLLKMGILGFITPEKYLLRKYGRNLRLLLLLNSVPLEFIDVSRSRDVFDVFTYPLITILRKSTTGLETKIKNSQNYLNRITDANPRNTIHFIRTSQFSAVDKSLIHEILDKNSVFSESTPSIIEHKKFENPDFHRFFSDSEYRFNFIIDPHVDELDNRFRSLSRLGNIELHIFSGTPRSRYYHSVKNNIIEESQDLDYALKFIMSRNICPYCIFWDIPVNLDGNEYQFPQYKKKDSVFSSIMLLKFHQIPKLILKGNSRNLTAAIDRVGYSFMGAYGLTWTHKFLNIEVLCAILNSDLINSYITKKYQSYMVNSHFLSINSIIVKDIPLPGKIDLMTGKFLPILSQDVFEKKIEKITQIVFKLEKQFLFIQSTGILQDQKKFKQFLYTSQLNTKTPIRSEKNPTFWEVQTLLKELNELVYDLYDIPQIIR